MMWIAWFDGLSAWVPSAFVARKQPSTTKFWRVVPRSSAWMSYIVQRLTTSPRIVVSSALTCRHGLAPAFVPSISIRRTVFRPWLVGFVLTSEPGCE